MWNLDVNNAYLLSDQVGFVAVKAPTAYRKKFPKVKYWRLLKILPGQREGAIGWNKKLRMLLGNQKLQVLKTDASLYFNPATRDIALSHVDDLQVVCDKGKGKDLIGAFTTNLKCTVGGPYSEPGDTFVFLKRIHEYTAEGCLIRPAEKYFESLAKILGFDTKKCKANPSTADLNEEDESEPLDATETERFRRALGTILYIIVDRPDAQHCCTVLSTFMSSPTTRALERVIHLSSYLYGTKTLGIFLSKGTKGSSVLNFSNDKNAGIRNPHKHLLEVLSDSDWASCKKTRRSISSGHVFLDGHLIYSFARLQKVVSLSSCESELYGLTTTVAEGLYISSILRELNIPHIFVGRTDSAAARGAIRREGVGRLRHIDARNMWLQQLIRESDVFKLGTVGTKYNTADLGTKVLTGHRRRMLQYLINMYDGKTFEHIGEAEFVVAQTDDTRRVELKTMMISFKAFWSGQ